MKLCSACLLGINCRFDGVVKPNQKILELATKEVLLPVCPEQLGGLSTPRDPSEQRGGADQVYSKRGEDVTSYFMKGAQEVLKLAELYGVKAVIFKQRSPSCGSGQIYDGSFSKTVIKGDGVTARLLKAHGIKILTEEDY